MYAELKASSARRQFKSLLGQTNHYLITLLVGLDSVRDGTARISPTFSTSWNPKSTEVSALRSREFVIKATLSWAIDALDAYLGFCHRRPTLYQDKELSDRAGAAGQKVKERFLVLKEHAAETGGLPYECISALTELAIQWRNNVIHHFAQNQISDDVRTILLNNSRFFLATFRSLDVQELLNQFDANRPPRFKEVTSIVSCIHKFVELSDGFLIGQLNVELHLIDCIDFHLRDQTPDRIAHLYNLSSERRINSLVQTASNFGFSFSDVPSATREFVKVIEILAGLKFAEAIRFFQKESLDEKRNFLREH
ncbi:MAG: hypothetical protein DMF63_05360 [Acidobacteria bacterium]|nr:MAG: hypothetical protein DMF63_05360 [Acidobacteriota bacterium]